ncbi:MAG: NAD(P)-binding protein [bacterium]|nr:NAD(P)-binding protein [bacterium]
MIGRRDLLKALGLGFLTMAAGCSPKSQEQFPVRVMQNSQKKGHAIFKLMAAPSRFEKTDVAIIGSGISGLSAAWKFSRHGLEDYRIFELEDTAGGNCRHAVYPESEAPWAAHYLPVPTREAKAVFELLDDMGLITGWDASGDPIYDESQLCHDPQERLYQFGKWTEGLFPNIAASQKDLDQATAFYDEIHRLQDIRDSKGRRLFSIPIAYSSDDMAELDSISMAEYLRQKGWDSKRLYWHIEYGCRDDYGTALADTSAWAALHYFAGRAKDRPGPKDSLFTWPEGNGHFVKHFLKTIGSRITYNALVFRISQTPDYAEIDYLDSASNQVVRVQAKRVICCFPYFLRRMLLSGFSKEPLFSYCPWATANIVLDSLPQNRWGFPLCWDNVIYDSQSLGYVVDTHQSITRRVNGPTVITWYRAYTEEPNVKKARWRLLHRSAESFRREILADLSIPHPDIAKHIRSIDVMLLGHAMIRPVPGLIFSKLRQEAAIPRDRLHFAHSDLSGISIFEEAQYHGIRAAEEVLRAFGLKYTTSLL